MREICPIVAYDRAGEGYADLVRTWLEDPHAHFRAFGFEARSFQARHRSERLRTMTLVAPAEELAALRPTCLCVDDVSVPVESWEQAFATAASRLIAANLPAFEAMQRDGLLAWMGCLAGGTPIAELLEANALRPTFVSLAHVVARVQWLFLMCGIRLNEVIVQVDPYTDEQWKERKAALARRRASPSGGIAASRLARPRKFDFVREGPGKVRGRKEHKAIHRKNNHEKNHK